MTEVTIHAKLVAKDMDCMGYISYVFENLEYKDEEFKYIMCVRFPNWNCPDIHLEDKGYVIVRYVEAGKDTWYDGNNVVPYKYTNVVFMKFIEDKPEINITDIVID